MIAIIQATAACFLSAFTTWWAMEQATTLYPPSAPTTGTPLDVLRIQQKLNQ